ncbi:uncharacterized protein LOC141618327 [Silene latifolia]|uniref:uncharacterized protein LOC141618327 n=1 Tax=Silene latifolia TaxID=37657 RepID=UPI003D78A090
MSSGYSGEFMHGLVGGGGAGRGNGTVRPPTMGGIQGGVMYGNRVQQQQQQSQFQQFQQLQQQQQQQVPGMMLQDQIKPRRVDPLMGKRSFGDYQSYQQHMQILQQQQQQREQPVSYIQRFQQQQQLQFPNQNQSLLLRSVKQRINNNNNNINNGFNPLLSPTIDLCSPTNNNNNNNININNNNNSLARFGVPVYQQPRQQQQQQIPFNQNYSQTQFNPTFSNNNNQIQNPGQNIGFAAGVGYSNNPVGPVQNKPESGAGLEQGGKKMLNTLEELEKHLLDDDDDNNFVSNDQDGDAVSGITNSEWSETFQNLMSPDPTPSPNPFPNPLSNPTPSPVQNPSQSLSLSPSLSPSPNTVQVTCNNNNVTASTNNINVISPSPTSSTSSCCSTSAAANGSPPTAVAVTVSAKQLISEVATAISDGKNDTAIELLSKLGQMANYEGNSEERLAYYMCNALKSRACPTENPTPVMELFGSDQMSSVYSLFDISPCFKFGLLAANLVMLEAITSAMQEGLKIHVIDFDVGHGAQYVNLLRALAEPRRLACTGIRITVVETELGNQGGVPESVRDSLVGLAERVGINLNYSCLNRSIRDLSWESLGCEEGEAVVVNFAFKLYRVPDESVSMENLRDELLRRVKGLSPRAVTLVEQDMNGNTAPFGTRVNEVCEYYGALFDSLEATLPRDNPDRCRVEKGLGRKMVNSVACEGRERVERAEVFGKWRARMGMAGFELKPLGQTVAESMRAKLNSARGGNPGFTVKDVNGGVGFGWKDRSLTVASAWR